MNSRKRWARTQVVMKWKSIELPGDYLTILCICWIFFRLRDKKSDTFFRINNEKSIKVVNWKS